MWIDQSNQWLDSFLDLQKTCLKEKTPPILNYLAGLSARDSFHRWKRKVRVERPSLRDLSGLLGWFTHKQKSLLTVKDLFNKISNL